MSKNSCHDGRNSTVFVEFYTKSSIFSWQIFTQVEEENEDVFSQSQRVWIGSLSLLNGPSNFLFYHWSLIWNLHFTLFMDTRGPALPGKISLQFWCWADNPENISPRENFHTKVRIKIYPRPLNLHPTILTPIDP